MRSTAGAPRTAPRSPPSARCPETAAARAPPRCPPTPGRGRTGRPARSARGTGRCAGRTGVLQPQLRARQPEPRAQHLGVGTAAAHPAEEIRVVVPAPTHPGDQRHNLARPVGVVRIEPGPEQRRDLVRQAHRQRERTARACVFRRRQDRLDLVVGDRRDDRRHRHEHRHASRRQRADRGDAPGRCRGARLQRPRRRPVEAGHRHRDRREAPRRHRSEDVDVARHAVGLGGDRHRMPELGEHLEAGAGDAVRRLDRLVGVGIGPHRDRAALVAALRQLGPEQGGCTRLGGQARFEIQPRRQAEIGVRRPREAVDAAVLAAAIGVDRAVEADVGRRIAGDDRARRLQRDLGPERRRAVEILARVEPVAVGLARRIVEARAAGVGGGTATGPELGVEHRATMRRHMEQDKNANRARTPNAVRAAEWVFSAARPCYPARPARLIARRAASSLYGNDKSAEDARNRLP